MSKATIISSAPNPESPAPQQTMAPSRPVQLASFKRRALAAMIDLIIMGIGLFLLILILGDLAFRLGIWGRLVGMVFIGCYLGWGNSRHMNGQTLGKRITKIAVVDNAGKPLSLSRSLGRAFVLAFLLLLMKGGVPLLNWPLWFTVLSTVGLGLMLTMAYAYIFNRTGQSVHDVLTDSYVIQYPQKGNEFPRPRPNFWREAVIVAIAGILLAAIGGRIILSLTTRPMTITGADLTEIQTLLAKQENVHTVEMHQLFTGPATIPRETWLVVTIWSTKFCRDQQALDSCQATVGEYGDLILENFNQINELDGLQITIQNQADFLIAYMRWGFGDKGSIPYWQERSSATAP